MANGRSDTDTTTLPAITDRPPPPLCTICSRPTKHNVQTSTCPEPRPAWTYQRLSFRAPHVLKQSPATKPSTVAVGAHTTDHIPHRVAAFATVRGEKGVVLWCQPATPISPPPEKTTQRHRPRRTPGPTTDNPPRRRHPPTDNTHNDGGSNLRFRRPKGYGVVGGKACGRG